MATIIILAVSLGLRGLLGGDPLIDLAAATELRTLPISLFSLLLETRRSIAKPLLVVGVVVTTLLTCDGMALPSRR